jgi:SET domain
MGATRHRQCRATCHAGSLDRIVARSLIGSPFDVGDGTVIDGAVGGNSARWINHACSPNCEAEDRDGRIFIRTVHPVPAGEELSIDYALVVEGRHTRQLRERYACHCGVPECRGTMLAARRRRIRIFERPSPDTLIVAWREAGRAATAISDGNVSKPPRPACARSRAFRSHRARPSSGRSASPLR